MPTILIIDDDPTLVEMLVFVLQRGGFMPRTAQDGQRAMEILATEPVDAVVLDVMLPDMDGFTICQHIRSNPRTATMPILMLSARTQVADRLTGFEVGADDYVPKPADPKEILARVRVLLQRAQRRPPPGIVITFAGAKGGVGTTTVALNVALALATEGRRVILVELTGAGPVGPWILGLSPAQTLLGLSEPSALPLTLGSLRTAILTHRSGLDYLAGKGPEWVPLVYPQGFLAETMLLLQKAYDVVIVDLGVSALFGALEVLRHSSLILPVTELDSVALEHVPLLRRWLEEHKLGAPGFVLVDRTRALNKEAPTAIAGRLGWGIVAVIPPAPEALYHAHARQEPLHLADPESEASLAYAGLARKLLAPRLEIAPELQP